MEITKCIKAHPPHQVVVWQITDAILTISYIMPGSIITNNATMRYPRLFHQQNILCGVCTNWQLRNISPRVIPFTFFILLLFLFVLPNECQLMPSINPSCYSKMNNISYGWNGTIFNFICSNNSKILPYNSSIICR